MNQAVVSPVQNQALQLYSSPNNFQPRPQTWSRFSIPTKGDSLSSGFDYDARLQRLLVTPTDWAFFTREVLEAAKLSFSDNKKAWGAGLAFGTAGTLTLLFLGPIAGYYTGKMVHRRTVIEKMRKSMLEDGKMSNVLQSWNEREWNERGFSVDLEFPDADNKSRADAKKFRLSICPGRMQTGHFPMRNQIQMPAQNELMGEQVGRLPMGSYDTQISQPQVQQYQQHQQQQPLRTSPQAIMSGALQQPHNNLSGGPQQLDSRQIAAPQQHHHISQQSNSLMATEDGEEIPALPARPSKVPLLDGREVYEMPENQAQTVFEMPDTSLAPRDNANQQHEVIGSTNRT